MAKNKDKDSSLGATMLSAGLYKRNQGRLVRQLTAVGLAIVLYFGLWTLSQGPLANYLNTYQAVNISYVAPEADAAVDAAIEKAITDNGGEVYSRSLNLERREIRGRFSTSKNFASDVAKGEEAVAKIGAVTKSLGDQFGSRVSVSQPIAQSSRSTPIRVGIPLLLAVLGSWVIYRVVNYPRFADFLIAVESEMDKVTWASKDELYRSTVVVIAVMFLLGMTLLLFDAFWQWFFQVIRFLRTGAADGPVE